MNISNKPLPGHRHTAGFTLIELLVVISIIAILVAMLLPTIAMMRSSAKSVVCMSSLRQIGIAQTFYEDDYKFMVPTRYETGPSTLFHWWELLTPYVLDGENRDLYNIDRSRTILTCPTFQVGPILTWKRGYAQNRCPSYPERNGDWITTDIYFPPQPWARFFKRSLITNPATRCLVMDYYEYGVGPAAPVYLPHRNTSNILFYDLHVAKVSDANAWFATLFQ